MKKAAQQYYLSGAQELCQRFGTVHEILDRDRAVQHVSFGLKDDVIHRIVGQQRNTAAGHCNNQA